MAITLLCPSFDGEDGSASVDFGRRPKVRIMAANKALLSKFQQQIVVPTP
jgi:hypothetical protein